MKLTKNQSVMLSLLMLLCVACFLVFVGYQVMLEVKKAELRVANCEALGGQMVSLKDGIHGCAKVLWLQEKRNGSE